MMAIINFNVAAFEASTRIDFKAVAQMALERSDSLLGEWFPDGKRSGKEYVVGDIHGNKGRSLSINTHTGVWKDFATDRGGQDLVSLYAEKFGVSMSQAAEEICGGGDVPRMSAVSSLMTPPPSFKVSEVKKRTWNVPTPWKKECSCVHPRHGKPSHVWCYQNHEGQVIGYVARYDAPGERKQFCPWTFDVTKSDWSMKKWPSFQPLYGMELLTARASAPVLIVEGEKACDAARRICGDEYMVMTWPGGASNVGSVDWSILKGRSVLIWPDADKAGVEAANEIAEALNGVANHVATLSTDGLPDKFDAADALADGWTEDKFNKWVAEQFSGGDSKPNVVKVDIKPVDLPTPSESKPTPVEILHVPGVLGKVVEWGLKTARKPQAIYSVAAALALGSVLMGRRYKTTLNNWPVLYLLAIGKSATGKEQIKTIIESILNESDLASLIGPNKYTSEAGVISSLVNHPTHVHITDEMGMQLEAANKDKGSSYRDISRIQMECFGRCHGVLQPVGYATAGLTAAQRTEVESRKVINPSLSMIAMTTPITFYDALGSKALRDGFINRFIVMECKSEREVGQFTKDIPVPQEIIEWCRETRFGKHEGLNLAELMPDVSAAVKPTPFVMDFEPAALEMFREMEEFALDEMNRLDRFGLAELWGRANEIAMRVSMIVARSCGRDVIAADDAKWAIAFVRHWTNEMVVSSGVNVTENAFDAAVQDVTRLVDSSGPKGMSMRDLRVMSRKFRALSLNGQHDVVKILIENGDHIAVERKGERGPGTVSVVNAKCVTEESGDKYV